MNRNRKTSQPADLATGHSGWLNLLIDCIIATALAAGLAEAVYQFRGLADSLALTILASAGLCLLLALLSRHWWIAPAAVGLPALLAALILWRMDLLDNVLLAVREYGQWAGSWLANGVPDPPEAYWLTILRFLLLLPLAAACLVMVRKITGLLFYTGLILLIFIPLLIWYPSALPALLLALCSLILMLPRRFLLQLRLDRPQDAPLPRAPMQILAIPAAILGLLLAQLLVPASTMNWRLPSLANPINDFGDLWQSQFGQIRAHDFFTLAPYGFLPGGSRLGGPAFLSNRKILYVYADQSVLLKGHTMSVYDGASWSSPLKRSYRLESSIWWQFRRDAFDQSLPAGTAGRQFLNQYAKTLRLEIEPLTSSQSTLFSAGRVQSVDLADELTYSPYFSGDGSLFVWAGMPNHYTYIVETTYLDRSRTGFSDALLSIETGAGAGTDRNWPAISQEYLQLPDSLPSSVKDTAQAVASPAATPYGQALLLESFFQKGFTYALNPAFTPPETDFVANFLENKEGYCVYYATALAVMARTLGIPSRYVEGFAMQHADSDKPASIQWQATGQTAHAWVELYFKGIGWITFDPTPAGYTDINTDPQPVVSPSAVPTAPPLTITPTPVPDPNTGSTSAGLSWILGFLALILAIGGFLAYTRLRHKSRFSPAAMARRYPKKADLLIFYYREILKQLSLLNISQETGDTLVQFAQRAERFLRLEGLTIPDLFWPVSCWLYGGIQPSPKDIDGLARLHGRLEERLKSNLSAPVYYFQRILASLR